MIGSFLVLEGIDGCGKSSQLEYLARWLPNSGLMPKGTNLLLTREPGGTELGIALRELLLNPPGEAAPEPLAELFLYAADRAQHMSKLVIPALQRGDWVVSDRFSGSTLAYQGYARQLNVDIIMQLERIATNGLQPDITLWLDLPVNESLRRRGLKPNDRIEAEGRNFLLKVASGFEDVARDREWIRVDANKTFEEVSRSIERAILNHFKDSIEENISPSDII